MEGKIVGKAPAGHSRHRQYGPEGFPLPAVSKALPPMPEKPIFTGGRDIRGHTAKAQKKQHRQHQHRRSEGVGVATLILAVFLGTALSIAVTATLLIILLS